jgi:hypothetical protein
LIASWDKVEACEIRPDRIWPDNTCKYLKRIKMAGSGRKAQLLKITLKKLIRNIILPPIKLIALIFNTLNQISNKS